MPIEEIRHAAKQAVAGVVAEFEAHQATAVDRRMRDQDRPLGAGSAESESQCKRPGAGQQEAAAALAELPGGTRRDEL